jgi:ABC-2 type transport system ATP-binding protein
MILLSRTQEIADYLQHGDVDLAVRRMLDLAWDTEDLDFIQQTVEWSKSVRSTLASPSTFDSSVTQKGAHFLEKASQLLASWEGASQQLFLEVKGLGKQYKKGNFSLKPIDLDVYAGEIIGIVGENGNGKTTLLRSLAGELAVSQGFIKYGFLQQDSPDFYTIKQKVSFVPQRIPRWYGRLKDNLHFSASISGLKGVRNEILVDFMLERLHLSEFSDLTWDQISSGYRTRFEMARVLLQRPQLLLLDEPLANLDINAQQTLLSDLRFMAKSYKSPMGVLLSSQQLFEVEKVADTVLFLKRGECLHRINQNASAGQNATVLEIETAMDRGHLGLLLGEQVQIGFNGGYYTLRSSTHDSLLLFKKLSDGNVPITYLRDISHSTKRFF